jgi:uncharacterized SAM-binding protein YcdF (DUF218 family)
MANIMYSIWKALIDLLKWLFVMGILIAIVSAVSFFTPLFSKVGLYFLQHLPIPKVPNLVVSEPTAYLLLGGGLTKDAEGTIVVNDFSRSRLQTLLDRYHKHPMPVILTGVESPWMYEWLVKHDANPKSQSYHADIAGQIISENASMNTCENARFTAKRLDIQHVYLITGAYHMTRARRQFALNGIATTPINAPLPEPSSWYNIAANYRHSKRTLYEVGAYLRDILIPQQDCRSSEEVSLETLKRSRKPLALKTF